jgi:hypothetical protein
MFGRHRTDQVHDLTTVVAVYHERLGRSTMTRRTDPPRIDPLHLRDRLAVPVSAGLRERFERPRLRTA